MQESLRAESAKLERAWMRHDAAMLRDYLVAEVEDPRLNVPSILTRHFLTEALFGGRFARRQAEELRFAVVMNWLRRLVADAGGPEDFAAVAHALPRQADNAEGIEIPPYVLEVFAALPALSAALEIPDYISPVLAAGQRGLTGPACYEGSMDVFASGWQRALAGAAPPRLAVLEMACGSANDYRFLEAFGLARLLDYTGLDLCPKNIENARALFPTARFGVGNVFEIDAPDQQFDYFFLHDLLEHLSPAGEAAAIAELCRVTRRGGCLGFFNMHEEPEPVIRPGEDYHWNTLSMARTRARFQRQGAEVQVVHIASFLRWQLECDQTHNPRAYTFMVRWPGATA